jgi:hypothetical protein
LEEITYTSARRLRRRQDYLNAVTVWER